MIPEIIEGARDIIGLIGEGKTPKSAGLRIGLYNSNWNVLGGGEAHALDVAAALSAFGQVELISERNFDLEYLQAYFGHEGRNFRKRLVSAFSAEVTVDYDIFVNSTYQSNALSLAANSYFIVFFPSEKPPEALLKCYHFLAISDFTLSWMDGLWGADNFNASVIYPVVPDLLFETEKAAPKQNVILSVGRFTAQGHTKNQLEIVEAFRRFSQNNPQASSGWKLMLVGSVNDADYLAEVHKASNGLDVAIVTDATFDELREYYRAAKIYVHASGYGRDPVSEPELCEHFGIAVAQALAAGCVPLVYDAGGPKEIIERAGAGRLWRTIDDLADALEKLASGELEENHALRDSIAEGAELYRRERLERQIEGMLRRDGIDPVVVDPDQDAIQFRAPHLPMEIK